MPSDLADEVAITLARIGDGPGAAAIWCALLIQLRDLAASDPSNAGWQRDLSVSYDRIGVMHIWQGETNQAVAERSLSLDKEAQLHGSATLRLFYVRCRARASRRIRSTRFSSPPKMRTSAAR